MSIQRLAALAVVTSLGIAGVVAVWPPPATDVGTLPVRVAPPRDVRRETIRRITPDLAWADEQAQAAIEPRLAELDQFFATVKQRTPKFSAEVLGWGSKWRFVADRVPFTAGGRHERYLRKLFNEHLFADDDLVRVLQHVTQGYVDALVGIENQMLVRIRQDVYDLPAAREPAFADAEALQSAYRDALDRALSHVGSEVKADVASFMLSMVAQEVVTQAAVRLGVSAGILGVGAGSSWATFGVGLVVGLIVDQLISWIWDWWADPKGALAEELNSKLDHLHKLLIDGEPGVPGLRSRLEQFAKERAVVRREAVMALVQPPVQKGLSAEKGKP
jgi:hypothetical protein